MRKGLLITICLLLTCVIRVQAQEPAATTAKTIDINIDASFDPAHVIGIFFSPQGSMQKPNATWKRATPQTVIVTIPYNDRELPKEVYASAIAFAADGQTSSGNIRPVFSGDPESSFLTIPQCEPKKANAVTLQSQLSLLESLVEVRSRRRGVAQVAVAQVLSDKFLERLRRLEKGFGLTYPQELNSDLAPAQLSDRLSRILTAIQSVKENSPQGSASSATSK